MYGNHWLNMHIHILHMQLVYPFVNIYLWEQYQYVHVFSLLFYTNTLARFPTVYNTFWALVIIIQFISLASCIQLNLIGSTFIQVGLDKHCGFFLIEYFWDSLYYPLHVCIILIDNSVRCCDRRQLWAEFPTYGIRNTLFRYGKPARNECNMFWHPMGSILVYFTIMRFLCVMKKKKYYMRSRFKIKLQICSENEYLVVSTY